MSFACRSTSSRDEHSSEDFDRQEDRGGISKANNYSSLGLDQ